MTPGADGPTSAEPARDSSDDTIELQLTEDEELALSRAAAASSSADAPAAPQYANFVSRRTARVDFVCNVTLAVTALAITVAFAWPTSTRHAPTPALASPPSLEEVVVPTKLAQLPEDPVRITNPFDKTEVFEFPSGTSAPEAQAAVAELLLDRARERRAEGPMLRRAKTPQGQHEAPMQPSAVFVTKLLAGTKATVNATD
jgi:hypothetical protein